MESQSPTPGAAELVASLGWVQRLALSLAHDRDAADDLTQEVARVWLERRPELADKSRGLRAWLAAVTRTLARDRMRSESARRARERSVARPESEGDLFDVVERGAWQKRVTEAVMQLPEPYRSTILYCYLDQLPTRAVAERMGVGEATVRKRLERGLASLRTRLHGGADRESHAKFLGILLMSTKAKLAAVAIAVGLVLLLAIRVLWVQPGEERAEVAETIDPNALSETIAQEGAAKPEALAAEETLRTAVEREPAKDAGDPTTGALRLHVLWGDDQSPAAGVMVWLHRDGSDALFEAPFATSDEKGTIRFVGLQPGPLRSYVERGEQSWSDVIEISAGLETESTVQVDPGMDCKGVVVDGEDRPIPGAEVLVAGWGGGQAFPLARTDAQGAFSLRAVGTHCHIGARAPGFAASPLRQFTARPGAKVEHRIVLGTRSSGLNGIVLDPQGRPAPGAVVEAGGERNRFEKMFDGSVAIAPMPERVRTGPEGRFEFRSLSPGTVTLAVRARGLAPWKQAIELRADVPNSVTVKLDAGVTLIGTVQDASGAGVAQATILLGDWGELDHRIALSDARGDFRIEGAGAGELHVQAEREGRGKTETTLQAANGETVRWNAVLSSGVVLRGLVLDVEGKPVPNAGIESSLVNEPRDVRWFGFENTDAAGRFSLKNCVPGEPIRITVRRKSTFPEVSLPRIVPGDEELVIRLPREAWIYIQGKVLDPEDQVLPNVHVSPAMKGGRGSPAETVDPVTGAFRYGPYPPGEYQLYVQADGYPPIHLPWRALGPDEVWDVGTLKLQRGGTILVNLLDASPRPRVCWVSILDDGGRYLENVRLEAGAGRAGPFAPGGYFVQISGEDVACELQPVEVRAGAELRVDVPVLSGVRAEFEFQLPEDVLPDEGVQVVILDASGVAVLRSTAWAAEGTPGMSLGLLPGSYRVEASKGALRGGESFEVGAAGASPKISVRLTPR
jgi:RNA polymerase sigma-70 factor (ECF subfamily)